MFGGHWFSYCYIDAISQGVYRQRKVFLVKINHSVLYLLFALFIIVIMVLLSCLVKLIEHTPAFVLHWGFSKIEPVEYSLEKFSSLGSGIITISQFLFCFHFLCLFFLHIPYMFCFPQDLTLVHCCSHCTTLSWYWVGQKVRSGFSVRCYGRPKRTFGHPNSLSNTCGISNTMYMLLTLRSSFLKNFLFLLFLPVSVN